MIKSTKTLSWLRTHRFCTKATQFAGTAICKLSFCIHWDTDAKCMNSESGKYFLLIRSFRTSPHAFQLNEDKIQQKILFLALWRSGSWAPRGPIFWGSRWKFKNGYRDPGESPGDLAFQFISIHRTCTAIVTFVLISTSNDIAISISIQAKLWIQTRQDKPCD